MSRTFAVGDVHGCDVALELLLDAMELTEADRIIMLGDVIDRGPDTRRVVEMLIDTSGICRLELIIGNHEQLFSEALQNPAVANVWAGWGGAEMLASYGGSFRSIPDEHVDFLLSGVPYVETADDICIHANLEPGVPLEEQSIEWLRWQKVTGREFPHESGKRVICGHTKVPDGFPYVIEGWVMIDTGAYDGGYLTAVDLGSGEILQARQTTRELRRGVFLDELA